MMRLRIFLACALFILLSHSTTADKCPFDDDANNCDCTGFYPPSPRFFDLIECKPTGGRFQPIKWPSKLTVVVALTISTSNLSNITIPANAFAAFDSINAIAFGNDQATTIISISLDPEAFDSVNVERLNFMGIRDLLPLPQAIVNTGSALTSLTIGNGGRVRIPANQFDGFNFLDTLAISNTHIESIDDRAFTYLGSSLQQLFLMDTALSAFPLTALSPLRKLIYLYMNGNNLNKWPKSAFANFPALASLSLAQNYFHQAIDAGVFDNFPRSVVSLDLTQTNLDKIPTELLKTEFTNLTYLILAGNRISRVRNGDIPPNSALGLLGLTDNPLTDMDKEALQFLPALFEINLDQSMMNSFDLSSLNGLEKISTLDLNYQRTNNFELKVSDVDKVPQSLTTIWLTNNNIRTISANLERVISRDKFRILDLGHANGFVCDQAINWMAKYVVCFGQRIVVTQVKCANLPGTLLDDYLLQLHPVC